MLHGWHFSFFSCCGKYFDKGNKDLFYLTVHGTVHPSREVKAAGRSWWSRCIYSQEIGRRIHAGVQSPLFTQLGSPASGMFPPTNKVGLHMVIIINQATPHKHAQRSISQVTLHLVMLTINTKRSQMTVERSWRRNNHMAEGFEAIKHYLSSCAEEFERVNGRITSLFLWHLEIIRHTSGQISMWLWL